MTGEPENTDALDIHAEACDIVIIDYQGKLPLPQETKGGLMSKVERLKQEITRDIKNAREARANLKQEITLDIKEARGARTRWAEKYPRQGLAER